MSASLTAAVEALAAMPTKGAVPTQAEVAEVSRIVSGWSSSQASSAPGARHMPTQEEIAQLRRAVAKEQTPPQQAKR
eukprot:CAMPEP_0118962952 /NCGR_PEP_ID=MMETSP1173-20130426/1085_1 /TAXON_ID=1034831 /ORGANISM="Rhizochromulina marina cf, Strain CCMP1243" /LENGTH=76 /DNA_ID=CAMNT_0006911263 /DNA_START=77 /DNA_END=307 /DNA_ORIENTATION=+